MSNELAEVKVSKDVIEKIIQANVQTAIATALSNERGVIEQVVAAVMQQKVNDKGERDSSSYYNSKTFIEWLCDKVIREATKEAVISHIEKNKDIFKEVVERTLTKNRKVISDGLVESLLNAAKESYRFGITIQITKGS